MPRPTPGTRADYVWFDSHSTRWSDNDAYGHLNNVIHYELMDTSITNWMRSQHLFGEMDAHLRYLVVESGCIYHAEARYPDPMTVGLRVTHIGRSSFRVEAGIFAGDADVAFAEGFFAEVVTDENGPCAIPDEIRALLEKLRPR